MIVGENAAPNHNPYIYPDGKKYYSHLADQIATA